MENFGKSLDPPFNHTSFYMAKSVYFIVMMSSVLFYNVEMCQNKRKATNT